MREMVERVRPLLPPKGRVIEFGNQRFTAGRDFSSTQAFYESLGFSYLALDVNENMGAKVVDLNVTGHDIEPADLVTNNGTSEHIFNQAACFENAHNMTKGLMLHILPFTPWLNHGFYNYNPILFRDLAAANEYEMVFTGVANRERQWIKLGDEGFIEKRPRELEAYVQKLRPSGEVFVVSVLKKVKDVPFRFPFQGKYKKDIANGELVCKYAAR
jgi:hypothetical protein